MFSNCRLLVTLQALSLSLCYGMCVGFNQVRQWWVQGYKKGVLKAFIVKILNVYNYSLIVQEEVQSTMVH